MYDYLFFFGGGGGGGGGVKGEDFFSPIMRQVPGVEDNRGDDFFQ